MPPSPTDGGWTCEMIGSRVSQHKPVIKQNTGVRACAWSSKPRPQRPLEAGKTNAWSEIWVPGIAFQTAPPRKSEDAEYECGSKNRSCSTG